MSDVIQFLFNLRQNTSCIVKEIFDYFILQFHNFSSNQGLKDQLDFFYKSINLKSTNPKTKQATVTLQGMAYHRFSIVLNYLSLTLLWYLIFLKKFIVNHNDALAFKGNTVHTFLFYNRCTRHTQAWTHKNSFNCFSPSPLSSIWPGSVYHVNN